MIAGIVASGMFSAGPPASVTWNPADKNANIVLTSGNLTAGKGAGDATFNSVRATAGIDAANSGYFEISVTGTQTPNSGMVSGLALLAGDINSYPGSDSSSWGYYHLSGQLLFNAAGTSYGASLTTGDVLGVAFKAGKVWFAKNNTYQAGGNPAAGTGEAFSGVSGILYPIACIYSLFDVARGHFKAADFNYAPPAGFNPWDPT